MRPFSIKFLSVVALLALVIQSKAQQVQPKSPSVLIANKVLETWPSDLSEVYEGYEGIWKRTGDVTYFKAIQKDMDSCLAKNNTINNVKNGHALLLLYKVTGQQKYFNAATLLWNQLQQQLQAKDGNFFGEPFYTEYAALIKNDKAFDDIAIQFILREKSLTNGYGIALVDALDNFPTTHPKRKDLLVILNRYAIAQQKVKTSNMLIYTYAKAARLGYLPSAYLGLAQKGYAETKKAFIGPAGVDKINDTKGVGAFLLASNEIELAALPKPGLGKTVLLDSYFNNESKIDQSGNPLLWHYKWDEEANGGFSFLGGVFNRAGFKTKTLYQAPTAANLKGSSIYIIVDPDFEKENPKPNFVSQPDINAITTWVNEGGVLVLMANDAPNAELKHFNELAAKFGVFFNGDSKGTVPIAKNYETAKVVVPKGHEIFKNATNLFIKEYSSLKLSGNAISLLKDKDGDNVMSVTKMGRGSVFIIGDPWLYNEYVSGRILPATYDNFKASVDLVNWLSKQ